jgi:hypothetical protein
MALKFHVPGLSTGKSTRGRPQVYRPVYDRMAERACAMFGATIPMLAQLFGVSKTSVEKWYREVPSFTRSVKSGRARFDTEKVENALLRRALGYTVDERRVEDITLKQKLGNKRVHVPATRVTSTVKDVSPDTTACMFWLQNRQPDKWRNVRHVEARADVNVEARTTHRLDLGKLGKNDLERLRDILERTATTGSGDADATGGRSSSGNDLPPSFYARLLEVCGDEAVC